MNRDEGESLGENEKELIAKGDAAYQEELNSVKPLPRVIEAARDQLQSLDRQLDQHLILLTKRKGESSWSFPSAFVGEMSAGTSAADASASSRENLHQAAIRGLGSSCGPNMNIWIITKAPVAHLNQDEQLDQFFLKGHIMAGQAQVIEPNIEDFSWLTKGEVEERLPKEVWEAVKDAL